jgi:tRNA dimethylallyltransferase
MPAPLVIVAGPTASGKSALALALAGEFGGTIINADSMQVYRELRVLTARPGPEAEALAPHRLYGTIDAAESCSVGRWRGLALAEIAAARAAGTVPILVGGTGLYLHALVHGIAAVPAIPAEARQAARALHRALGGAAFHARLAERDPEGAQRLGPHDTQRLVRAWEVVAATGRPLGAWQRLAPPADDPAAATVLFLPPRTQLYAACDARLAAMMERGAVEEVAALLARGLAADLPAMKAVGVREIADWLAGRTARDAAIAAAQQATRRYAKRQYTWLGRRMGGLRPLTISAQFSESYLPEIFAFIRRHLLTATA